jgi:two-component system, OmpR family, sensor kinase
MSGPAPHPLARWLHRGPAASAEAALLRRATRRLGLQVALCVAAIVVVLSCAAVLIVLRSQHSAADTLLSRATSRADDVTDPPAGEWLLIRSPTGVTATPGLPVSLPDRAALDRTARTGMPETDDVTVGDDQQYRVHTQRRGRDTVQAVLDLSADHRERDRLVLAMLASGGVGLVLAAGAGVWFGRRAVRPMAEALALQRRFVADAGHELRTPLTLLSTRAQLLRRHLRGGAPDMLAGEMDGVIGDARHLADILEDLLLAADTRADTSAEVLDLAALTTQVIAAGVSSAAERSVTLADRTKQQRVLVRGTQAGLRRALTALLDNAVRHARSTVTLTVRQAGPHSVVEVVDDGPGIDSEILPHLFDRFASTSRGAPAPGTHHRRYGLGLALVGEITARHGGTVSASNPPGGGATLRLTLPALTERHADVADGDNTDDSKNFPSSGRHHR